METIESSRYNEQKYTTMVGALLLRHQFAEGHLHSNNFDDYHDYGKWYDNTYDIVEYMVPSKIRFSQENISKVFSGEPHTGYPIKTLTNKLVKGNRKLDDMELILPVVVDNDSDKVYTMGNRRLWAFREAERRGKCTEITVRILPFRAMRKARFPTRNDGRSVRILKSGSDAQSWSGPKIVNPDFDKYTSRNHTNNRGNRTRRLIENGMKEQDFSL